jgi:hypothetical protein
MSTIKESPTAAPKPTLLLPAATILLHNNLPNPMPTSQLIAIPLQAFNLKPPDPQPSNTSLDHGLKMLPTPTPAQLRMELHQWIDGRMKASKTSLGISYRAYTFVMEEIWIYTNKTTS